MKITIILFLLSSNKLLFGQQISGQTNCDTISIFSSWIEYPKPELHELLRCIYKKMVYPETALKDKIEGSVVVSFVVDTLGFTHDHKIVRGVREDLDNEVLRVAKLIKFDEPAKNRGKPVMHCYSIPFSFSLSENVKQSRWWQFRRR